jgi:hypothetical protein
MEDKPAEPTSPTLSPRSGAPSTQPTSPPPPINPEYGREFVNPNTEVFSRLFFLFPFFVSFDACSVQYRSLNPSERVEFASPPSYHEAPPHISDSSKKGFC